ncbi:MAG: A/G-specific adenine glycosylase [Phocaeicola sp.]|uniref:A/G-specific adenine glycosylase n=1 Tax=Phocaeicola TaxID=909656 RepID=UPI00234F0B67|nr:A/G-specific adenine glycosylase [Phocaeicola oris]MCE2615545.1 A/G-specific adenine glycosylase [Phocaeicola oris]
MNDFSNTIINWYEEHKRDLPWRKTKDPFLIWVSEIILQQTRVEQGLDYYQRFVSRFPNVFKLAEAEEDEVLKCWQGLGYYSRARNIHMAAKQIAEIGEFPKTLEDVLNLRGVGEYTAAAICSFAYDMPYAVVDGNVYRVLSRWLGIDRPIDSGEGKRMISEAAKMLLDKNRPALHNQAIMEFGALQCTKNNPNCMFCPLIDCCIAYKKGLVETLPVKQHKTKTSNRYYNYIFVRMGEETVIHKRIADDIWKNLYEFPMIETDRAVSEEEFYSLPQLHNMISSNDKPVFKLVQKGVKHVLSHRIIYANFYEVNLPEDSESFKNYHKIKINDIHKFAVSRLINQFLSLTL